MFVREESVVNAGFPAAQSRLARLGSDGWLTRESGGAYDCGLVGLMKVGPLGSVPGTSKLVRVCFRDLVLHEGSAVLTLRWEATGPGGGLFPALDADITLTPAGADKSLLTLDGAYRPPLAAVGAGLDRVALHRVATLTVRSLLARIAEAVSGSESETGEQ